MKTPSRMKVRVRGDLRPLLWSLRWRELDAEKDKEDIIVNTINEGTLAQWKWLIKTFGKGTIRRILMGRLATEFHPESRNLARIVFDIPKFRNAQRGTHQGR